MLAWLPQASLAEESLHEESPADQKVSAGPFALQLCGATGSSSRIVAGSWHL